MKTEKNIFIAFLLNIVFSIIEFFGGFLTGSIAIISDAVHDLGDAFSIGVSFFLEKKSKKGPDEKHTYGYIRYSVLGSVITTSILIVGSIFVIVESVNRLFNPVEVNYEGMIFFAIFGVIINFIASLVTKDGDSLNQKSVNLHMLEDVFGWLVVLIGSIIMKFTNITYIDSILSICVAIFILINALKTLKDVLDVFLEVTPKNVDLQEIRKHLLHVKGVKDVHHIHVRSIDGFNNYATLHVVVEKYSKDIKNDIREELEEHGIVHSTIELELVDEECKSDHCEIKVNSSHHHHHHH